MENDNPPGWRIDVTSMARPLEQTWLAAIPNKDEAESAVKARPEVLAPPFKIESEKANRSELDGFRVPPGGVRQWR